MPDFNPAIAAQVQPPQAPAQPNFGQTLSTIADFQRAQAATELTRLQALQATRKYNGLLAASQAMAHGGDPLQAGAQAGADPADINQLLAAGSSQKFMSGHGGLAPAGAEAVANIARTKQETAKLGIETQSARTNLGALSAGIASTPGGVLPQAYQELTGANKNIAETANTQAQLPGIQAKSAQSDMEFRGGIAQSLAADPSDDNWKANVPQLVGHVSPQGMAQILDAYKNPDKRPAVAKSMIAAALPPADATKLEQYDATKGLTTPLERLGGTAGNPPQAPQAGPAQAGSPAPSLLGGRGPMSPGAVKLQEGFAGENVKDITAANEAYKTAGNVQAGLLNLQNNLDQLPTGGYWTTGKDAGTRLALAKTVNTAVQAAGGQPIFDPAKVAAGEAAQKGTTKLGFDLAKTLGSREAAMIVQQSIGVQPGIEMTPEGNHHIMTALMVAAQRDKDYGQFVNKYVKDNPNMTPGEAQIAFNQQHPPSEYVQNYNKVLQAPKAAVDMLRKNPKLAQQFDAKYGGGENLSRFLLAN